MPGDSRLFQMLAKQAVSRGSQQLARALQSSSGTEHVSSEAGMKDFLVRLLLAAGVTLAAFALASSTHAQQGDEDPAATTPRQQQPAATPQSPQKDEAHAPSSGDPQTQDALSFTGRVVKQKGQIILKDPVTKLNYQFDDPSKAKQYVGKQVKVTGKLDMSSNTIHVQNIEALP